MRTFNFICRELSLLLEESFIGARRFDLWTALSVSGWHPSFDNDDPHAAADCLENSSAPTICRIREAAPADGWEKTTKNIRNFKPKSEMPEEIFERISRGLEDL